MLVSYSSSSEEETENVTDRRKRPSPHNDTSPPLRKRYKPVTETKNISNNTPVSKGGSVQKEKDKPVQTLPRLPLPDSVLGMFKDTEDQWTEDSSQHGGRVRSFQHERGNWATYVYLPYNPEDVFFELLDEMTEMVAAHGIPLTRAEEFHLSLSQTVVLRHHWIQPFMQSLRTGLAQCRRSVYLAEKMKIFSNHEKTRTFLGMEVTTGHAQLLELVRAVDGTMEEFNLSTFYQNPSFHVSLAWCIGDYTEQLRSVGLSKLQALVDCHEDGPFQLRMDCTELRCKSGNKVFAFPLC